MKNLHGSSPGSRKLRPWVAALTLAAWLAPVGERVLAQSDLEDDLSRAPVSDHEFYLSVSAEEKAEIIGLIRRLSASRYTDRSQAAERLMEKGISTMTLLRTAYHESDELEMKLQIERIVLAVYLDEYVYGRSGFLGITQRRAPHPTHTDDPRIPEGHIGIVIDRVHNGTAAFRAGLADEDIIVAVDDEFIRSSANPTEAFGDLIRRRGPGGKIKLTVLRRSGEITTEVTLGRCPPEMVERGQIQSVTKRLFEVRDRFDLWWDRYFMDAAAAGVERGTQKS